MSYEIELFESWQRHNKIIQNVAKKLNDTDWKARATPSSPSVAEQLAEMHDTRTYFLKDTAPEFIKGLPLLSHWDGSRLILQSDNKKILAAIRKSEKAMMQAVQARSLKKKGKTIGLDARYSHPVQFLQHMLWHEAYHMGQIMLALKVSGNPMDETTQQKAVWKVWKS